MPVDLKWTQVDLLPVCLATIGAFGLGTVLAWPSPALEQLVDCSPSCDLNLEITEGQASWIVSTAFIGAFVGAIVRHLMSGPSWLKLCCFQVVGQLLMPRFGCKWSMMLMSVPSTTGWLCLVVTEPLNVSSPVLLYVGRFLTGEFCWAHL